MGRKKETEIREESDISDMSSPLEFEPESTVASECTEKENQLKQSNEPPFSTKWLFLMGLCVNIILIYSFPSMTE